MFCFNLLIDWFTGMRGNTPPLPQRKSPTMDAGVQTVSSRPLAKKPGNCCCLLPGNLLLNKALACIVVVVYLFNVNPCMY